MIGIDQFCYLGGFQSNLLFPIVILSSLTLSLLNLCVVVSIIHLVLSALIAILFVSTFAASELSFWSMIPPMQAAQVRFQVMIENILIVGHPLLPDRIHVLMDIKAEVPSTIAPHRQVKDVGKCIVLLGMR